LFNHSVRGTAALPILFAMAAALAAALYAAQRLLYSDRANEFFHRVE
jgi:hypothetical protein